MKKIILVLFLAIVSLNAEEIMVLAAASLKFALEDIKTEFLKDRKNDNININYIASGKAYNQIVNGAPAQLFIAADTQYPQKLYDSSNAASKPISYAKGKLVIFSTNKNLTLNSIQDLKNSNIKHIALPNPKLAPYGVAGEEALKNANIYKDVESKIVLGESIAQAYQYTKSGASEAGFNALSMVIKDKDVKYIDVNDKLYKPILQAMVITKYGANSKLAKDFEDFILSPKAQAIFASYGYDKP